MKNPLKIYVLITLAMFLAAVHAEESSGNFYRVNNTSGVRGVRALASHIVIPRTSFRYTPGTQKQGVLDDLTLKCYAISQDNSTLALAESYPQDDGKFLNRIIFFEMGALHIINGIEYTANYKIEKVFFFMGNLYCITKGEKINLRQLRLTRNLKFDPKTVELTEDVSSIKCDRKFIYIKSVGKLLWQFNEELKFISSLETRFAGGFLLIRNLNDDKMFNFTRENLETIQRTPQGLFKSSYRDLQDMPEIRNAWLSPIKNSIYFSTPDGELHELVDMAFSEKLDVADFQQIIYHPYKREFYILAKKKHIIEIVRLSDFKTRKRISHHTMRPETHQNLKFMIPFPGGLFIITQQGEFATIRERKRRFYKYKF